MNNAHHGGEVGNRAGDTLHDKADSRDCGEGVLRSHGVDGSYRSEDHRLEGCGV